MRTGRLQDRVARWSLRRRVLVAYGVVLVVALGVGVVGFAVALDRILIARTTDAAVAQSEQIGDLVSTGEYPAYTVAGEVPSQGSIVQVLSGDRVAGASETDARAVPLTSERPPAGTSVTRSGVDVEGEGGAHVVVATGVTDPSGAAFTVVVAAPLEDESRTVQVATTLVAAGAVVLVVVLLLLGDRILASALRPVERIRGQVSSISRAGSGERVSVPESDDEIAELARTMNGMLDRLERADAASRRFVSDASHELRSPVATIRATIETAEGPSSPDRQLVHGETLRLHRLVDDLLVLARADDRGVVLDRRPLDLDDLVAAEVRRLRSMGGRPTADLVAVRVEGDPHRLEQVLRNLTENALRYGTGGLRLLMETADGRVRIHVDNEGPPVPEAQREAVFERFTRLDESRARADGGSGLGLSIARTLAEAHRGTVLAGEAPDGWCRFTLVLPVDDGQ